MIIKPFVAPIASCVGKCCSKAGVKAIGGKVLETTPFLGTPVKLGRTVKKCTQATTVPGMLSEAAIGLIDACCPPVIKYPAKCIVLFSQIVVATSAPNPFSLAIAVNALAQVVERVGGD